MEITEGPIAGGIYQTITRDTWQTFLYTYVILLCPSLLYIIYLMYNIMASMQ